MNLLYEKPANKCSSEPSEDLILKSQQNNIDSADDTSSLPVEESNEKKVDQKLQDIQQNEKSQLLEENKCVQEDPPKNFAAKNASDEVLTAHHQDNSTDSQEKPVNQSQNNNYSYWHFWPLYYFA